MEAAQSIEPAEILKVLPKIVFDTSYGKTAFGGEALTARPSSCSSRS